MDDASTPYPLHEELPEAVTTSESGEGGQLLDELAAHGLHQPGTPLHLWLSAGKAAPATEAETFIRIDVGATPHPTALANMPLAELALPAESVDGLVIDGLLETLSFPEALAHIVRWQQWLRPSATIRIITADVESCSRRLLTLEDGLKRQHLLSQLLGPGAEPYRDGWYRNKLQRVLQGFGFEIVSLKTKSGGLAAPHVIEALATQECHTPLHAAKRAAQSILADALDTAETAEAYREFEFALGDETKQSAPAAPTSNRSQSRPEIPIVSVIVLTYNQLEDTKVCLQSIEKYTETPYELLLVDNASTDGTVEYLRAFAEVRAHVKLVLNNENHGFAKGNNIGMAVARGAYYVLLNNDTIVTRGWLNKLLGPCREDHRIALVGPRSNNVAGAQRIPAVAYSTETEMQVFADELAKQHAGLAHEVIRLVGFCLLIRADVIERIGGLDERYGRGNFEDDDLCLRAYAAGFGARIAADAFVHHSGSKTFRGAGIDYRKALEDNWEIFKDKWGIPASRPLEDGLPFSFEAPEGAMEFINTPDIGQTHKTDEQGVFCENAPVIITSPSTNSSETSQEEIMRRFDEAEATAQAGHWRQAAELFLQLIESFPTFGPAYVALASAAFAIDEIDVGIEALKHAHTIYPKNIDILLQLGVVLAHRAEYDKAEAQFLKVLEIEENNVDALVSLAQMCRVRKQFVEAVQLVDQANQLAPTNPVVIGAIGTLALELGDAQGAAAALKHLQACEPEHHETKILAERLTGLAEDAAQ